MTSKRSLKYNHQTKPLRLNVWMVRLETTFPGQVQTRAINELSDCQSVAHKLMLEHTQAMYLSRPQWTDAPLQGAPLQELRKRIGCCKTSSSGTCPSLQHS